MSDTYEVERSITIAAPAHEIYERIADFQRWRAWSPWEDVDPDLRRSYDGPSSGVGASYAWEGNRKAGTGRMEIVDVEPDRRVAIDLRFEKPFKSQSNAVFSLDPTGDSTEVRWTMTGPKTFMTRVMGIFTSMDKMVGPDFEKGLSRLKDDAEA